MSTEYRVVPVELLDRMINALDDEDWLNLAEEAEAIKSAPVPPAGVEAIQVQAVAVTRENEDGELFLDWLLEGGICELELSGQVLVVAPLDSITDDEGHGEVFMAAHVTRLQAEVERLSQSYETVHEVVVKLKAERDALQAEVERQATMKEKNFTVVLDQMTELTKARELLRECQPALDKSGYATWQIDELLAHQSAPAAKPKSWPCWSCKAPVTMANRADADGCCPHCEAELDLEDWPAPAAKDDE